MDPVGVSVITTCLVFEANGLGVSWETRAGLGLVESMAVAAL
ncbi:MAG TPA: hypothetical protein VL285_08050 [Bryobacteraceae bacterium]|nr:hypothetical protein [Bryobacteraceae bacterium]